VRKKGDLIINQAARYYRQVRSMHLAVIVAFHVRQRTDFGFDLTVSFSPLAFSTVRVSGTLRLP
jgi:hypothetical protein